MAFLQTLHQEGKGLGFGDIRHQQSRVWSAALDTPSQIFHTHLYKHKASSYWKSYPPKVLVCRHQE